jgi:hypothetical protein
MRHDLTMTHARGTTWAAAGGGLVVSAVALGLMLGAVRAQQPTPLALDDHAGFTTIFDGSSMGQWDGDPAFWRVEGGVLIGQSTDANPLKRNTFVIWRGGTPADFDLVLEYRITAGNSGIQYRSREVTDVGRWAMSGYQADIDYENRYTGQLYEERGRGFLAMRGQATVVGSAPPAKVVGHVEDADALKAAIQADGWNHFRVIARGNVLTHIVNGRVMSVTVDDDEARRTMDGLIGIQMHTGPPMKVEVRNVRIRALPAR